MNPHFAMLRQAQVELEKLDERFVFLGGATVSLHIDDPAAKPARATEDVDLVVEVAGYSEYSSLEARLREIGFFQSLEQKNGPICRWSKDSLVIDVMPTEPEILGFSHSKWFREGFEQARVFRLPTGESIEAFRPLHLMAAKIEAFEDRGNGDWLLSQDIEDIATILDGRRSIFEELSGAEKAATFVRHWLKKRGDGLPDFLAGHIGDYQRAEYLVTQLQSLGE